jgi:tetratricopeptide (TPR) repeat protein
MRYKYILHITILLLTTNIYSQNIDSLFVEGTKFINKQDELQKLDKLTNILRQKNLSTSLPYYQRLIAKGKRNKDTLLLTKAYLEIAKKYQDKNYLFTSELYLDSVFNNIHNNTLELASVLCNALTTRGNLAQLQGDQKDAFDYFKESLLIAKKNDFNKYILYNQNNIAMILLREKKVKEALKYFKENIKEARKENEELVINISLLNIGNCYNKLQQLDSATYFFEKAILKSKNNNYLLVRIYQNYALVKINKKEYLEAELYIKKSFLIDSLQYPSYLLKGYINVQKKEYSKALKDYLKSKKIIEQKKIYHELPHIFDSISKLYQTQEQYAIANEYLIKSIKMTDSLANVKKKSKLNNLKKIYNIDIKNQKIQDQKSMIEIAKVKIENSNILMIVSVIILLGTIFYYFIMYIR